jgi:hypothetical protein
MPSLTLVSNDHGQQGATWAVSNGTSYILVAAGDDTVVFNNTASSAVLTLTKIDEASFNGLKMAVYAGIATGTGSFLHTFTSSPGASIGNIVYSLSGGRGSNPLLSAAYSVFQGHTPVASGVTDGIELTPPHASGRFVRFIYAKCTGGAGSQPDPATPAGYGTISSTSGTNGAGSAYRMDAIQQTADNASTTPVELDPTWNAFSGTSPTAIEMLMWISGGNVGPNTPTAFSKTGSNNDTTPNFQCDVDDIDFNFSEQVRGRFVIETAAGAAVGNVTSAFRASPGTVTAEYGTGLAVGNYRARAEALDDDGFSSAATGNILFSVTSQITKDLAVSFDVFQTTQVTKDLQVIHETIGAVEKDLSVLFNVYTSIEKDLEVLYYVKSAWHDVENPDPDTVWTPIIPPVYS